MNSKSANTSDKTIALEQALSFFDSALNNQPEITQIVRSLIDVSLAANSPLSIGTVLSFIKDPSTHCIYRQWSHLNEEACTLSSAGEALSDIHHSNFLSSLPTSRRALEHFRGGLDKYYLLALLAERIPNQPPTARPWVQELRAWLFLHAYIRANRSIRLDENLQTVARSLRIGSDTDTRWLRLFLQLRPIHVARSFLELNAQLIGRARQLLTSSELLDKERKTLKALIEIANNRDKLQPDSELPPALTIKNTSTREISSNTDAEECCFCEHPASINVDTKSGISLVTEIPPFGYTPAQRKLSAKTVLMANAEAIQLLPWSWHKPNPTETTLLRRWIDNELASKPPSSNEALAAAFIWTAVTFGRSTTLMLALGIDNTTKAEWQFDPKRGSFTRHPPMRSPGWLPTDAGRSWIQPAADEITIQPPTAVQIAIQTACQRSPQASTFRELWPAGSSKTPEQIIGKILKKISPRLTGSMLQGVLLQHAFGEHQDATLARLIASHPQTPLSGTHSYSGWCLDTVTRLLSSNNAPPQPQHNKDLIGLGSRLAVFDNLIRDALLETRNAVIQARKNGDIIRCHNFYTAYIVIALLALTGARPIRSPFESLDFFDFDANLVFIDDKHSGSTQRTGRVVPLTRAMSAFLLRRYLPHLQNLANILANTAPELSNGITRIVTKRSCGEIPLFFFLDEQRKWKEITPSSLFLNANLNWPLPANLFRHRLPNRLRALGVDPEIIDGIMGHGEWSCETWDYLSFRNWRDDAESVQPALESAFRVLHFYPLRGFPEPPSPQQVTPAINDFKTALFGAEARERERRRRYISTVREAELTIRLYLQERELASLDQDELDLLADKLTKTPEGMPIPTGKLRLSLLFRKLERIQVRTGKSHRPSKERLMTHMLPSMFSARAPQSLGYSARVKDALDNISPKSPETRRIAAAFSLCAESRISDIALLRDVLLGSNYRLVRIANRYYLEHGEVSENNDTAGRRFGISTRTAQWLQNSTTTRKFNVKQPIPTSLHVLTYDLSRQPQTVDSALTALAEIIEQANALTFPGIVCGVLSGKLETTALGWRDAIRLKTGKKIHLPTADTGIDVDLSLTYRGDFKHSGTQEKQREANLQLLDSVRLALKTSAQAKPGTPNVYRSMRAAFQKAIREGMKACASPSLLTLAEWLLHQARPEHRHAPKPVSLRRYWTALAWRFNAELNDFNFLEADEEEMTDAYTRILLSSGRKAGSFELERLGHFHRWLSRTFEVEHPQWNELPLVSPGIGVSPGFINPQEYLDALQHLIQPSSEDIEILTSAAMTLLLAYRFGLRKSEALYLAREDWDDSATPIVVTVRGNRWRKLKSSASQRQVPLLFALTELEQEIVTRALALYATRHGIDHSHPLLAQRNPEPMLNLIRVELKRATGNPGITLHHARHSAANLVGIIATRRQSTHWCWPDTSNDASLKTLTDSQRISRRNSWAISRYLGHASPRTSCRSYLHFIFDWADELIDLSENPLSKEYVQGIPWLDELEEDKQEDERKSSSAPLVSPVGPGTILKAFRLHARKISPAAIASSLGQSESLISNWLNLLKAGDELTLVGKIVHSLAETAWDRLILWSASIAKIQYENVDSRPLTQEEINEMIGEKHQLLAWTNQHFALLRLAVDVLQIDEKQYRVYGSARLHQGTRALASAHGFTISERPFSETKSSVLEPRKTQIDSAFTGANRDFVTSRVAVIFEENATLAIRNRPQFALLTASLGLLL